MPIEVEVKARVPDRAGLLARLADYGPGEPSTYSDTYYDLPDGSLSARGSELRVRTVQAGDGNKTVFTFKTARIDATSQPEHETTVGDPAAIAAILSGLGYRAVLAFEKHCINYRVAHHGRATTVTVVQVPELSDETFVEVETVVDHLDQAPAAADTVQTVLHGVLGLPTETITDELYTDAVRRHRT